MTVDLCRSCGVIIEEPDQPQIHNDEKVCPACKKKLVTADNKGKNVVIIDVPEWAKKPKKPH